MDVVQIDAPVSPSAIIVTEFHHDYNNDTVTLLAGATNAANQLAGKVTASGKYVPFAPGASDGSQNVAGFFRAANAVSGTDEQVAIHARGPSVIRQDMLVFPAGITGPQTTAALAQLVALGIVPRVTG